MNRAYLNCQGKTVNIIFYTFSQSNYSCEVKQVKGRAALAVALVQAIGVLRHSS